MRERLVALAVLFVGAAIASAAPRAIAVLAIAIPLVALAAGPRLRLDRLAQAALAIGAMVGGVLAPRLLLGPESSIDDARVLGQRTLLLALPMLAVAGARALVDSPVFGARLTLIAALVALTAAGRAQTGLVYPALSALAVASGLAALWLNDPRRAGIRLLGPRHVAAVSFGAAVAVGLALLSSWSLPRLHDAAIARLMERWNRNRTGFSGQMFLGDMAGMLQSDKVVMRVRGAAPELLRGAVFSGYVGTAWEAPEGAAGIEVVETPPRPADPSSLVEIENAGRPVRYFLPLGAGDVVVSSRIYERDALAIHTPSSKLEAKRVWFAAAGGRAPVGPLSADLRVKSAIQPALIELLHAWGVADADPRRRVEAIAERLRSDYRYSTVYERSDGVDPVLDFLTTHRAGHCEYFASALVLLARASAVPARLVTGYRVAELSPLGYAIVRERHAHAWVEVWLDGAWTSIDATPAADLSASAPSSTPFAAALADGLSTAWERVDDWLERRSAFELSLIVVGLAAVLLGVRALRGRSEGPVTSPVEPPLPGFSILARALEKRGVARAPTETLSRFARRIEGETRLPESLRSHAAELVRRYELVRYAGRGDGAALEREMTQLARQWRAG